MSLVIARAVCVKRGLRYSSPYFQIGLRLARILFIYTVFFVYAELHCLSHYSFLRGASAPEELVNRAIIAATMRLPLLMSAP